MCLFVFVSFCFQWNEPHWGFGHGSGLLLLRV